LSRHWVYILRCADGSLYTGVTTDVARRIAQHNSRTGAKYTRSRVPVTLVFAKRVRGRGAALKREIEIKKMSRSAKLLLCASYSPGD
jgi:putative endonuclease